MYGKKPIRSRRPCPQCGGPIYYVATFLTPFTGLRKRMCPDPKCGYVDPCKVKIVSDSAQVF
jgi:hypothetical protein